MDTQPLIPNSGPFSSPSAPGSGKSPLMLMMIVVLGLGTVGFGAATVVFSNKAATATKTLNQKVAAAVTVARADQKKNDDIANTKVNESPFRSYTAPNEFGSFVVNFPKNWASYVDQEPQGTQVHLVLNPDFVRKTNGQDELMAARVMLIQRPKDQYLQQYSGLVKKGTLKQSETRVSGLTAYDLVGAFSDRKTIRMVVVPIRDKVLVFSTENSAFASEFQEILAQAKIIP